MVWHLYTVLYFITGVFFKQMLFTQELFEAFSVFLCNGLIRVLEFLNYYFFVLGVLESTDQNGFSRAIWSSSGITLRGNIIKKQLIVQ